LHNSYLMVPPDPTSTHDEVSESSESGFATFLAPLKKLLISPRTTPTFCVSPRLGSWLAGGSCAALRVCCLGFFDFVLFLARPLPILGWKAKKNKKQFKTVQSKKRIALVWKTNYLTGSFQSLIINFSVNLNRLRFCFSPAEYKLKSNLWVRLY
jgi:hypothetical protein